MLVNVNIITKYYLLSYLHVSKIAERKVLKVFLKEAGHLKEMYRLRKDLFLMLATKLYPKRGHK